MTLEELRLDYELFGKEVNIFCVYEKTLKSLYLEADTSELNDRLSVSPIFFKYHHQLLLERIYLSFRQFSDSSGRMRKNGRPSDLNHNLSFWYFLELLQELKPKLPYPINAPSICEQFSRLESEIGEFNAKVDPIKRTLHKKIGHFSKDVRQSPEDLVWLERVDFEIVCDLIPKIANHIGLLGWSFSQHFVDADQNGDLWKLKRKFSSTLT